MNEYEYMQAVVEQEHLNEMEELAEKVQEAIDETFMEDDIAVNFTSQYVQLTLSGAILFDSGKVALRQEALPILDRVGIILERYATSIIEIEGHTDTVPQTGTKYENNDELSAGRALSVFNYFVETTTLDPAMIKHSGRGEYVPVADNSTPEGRAKNRRVEIRIYHHNIQ